MDLKTFRKSRGLSQRAASAQLGLTTKSHLSTLERGDVKPSLRLALMIEDWSDGAVRAVDLLRDEDRELLQLALDRFASEIGAETP